MHAENLFHLSSYSQTFYHHGCHVGRIRNPFALRARTCAIKLLSSTRLISTTRGWVVICTQNPQTHTKYIFSSP